MTQDSQRLPQPPAAIVIGGGPAGLAAAEALAQAGIAVHLYDAMPSVGRKFLLAGIGGLNLTHSEPLPAFVSRYGEQAEAVAQWLQKLTPQELRDWAAGLGVQTFVGSSGRVFPADMKAAPLLRAWLQRLRGMGVQFHMRHRWLGWQAAAPDGDALTYRFAAPEGEVLVHVQFQAVVLALGGASWPQLGSDGAWVPWLQRQGVEVAKLQPSNCGFEIDWSSHFSSRHAGAPLKSVALQIDDWHQVGECVVTATGIEGSLIYAASSRLRERIRSQGWVICHLDLMPHRSQQQLQTELAHPRGSRSLSSHLKSRLRLDGVKAGLLWEGAPKAVQQDPAALAAWIKAVPLRLVATRPMAEAISSAGGVRMQGLSKDLMLQNHPGLFCAGEMLDWEAPTGGYLLNACLASGKVAGQGAAAWLGAGAAARS